MCENQRTKFNVLEQAVRAIASHEFCGNIFIPCADVRTDGEKYVDTHTLMGSQVGRQRLNKGVMRCPEQAVT